MNLVKVVNDKEVEVTNLVAKNYPPGTIADTMDNSDRYWMVTGDVSRLGSNQWISLSDGWRGANERNGTGYVFGRVLPRGTKIEIEIA